MFKRASAAPPVRGVDKTAPGDIPVGKAAPPRGGVPAPPRATPSPVRSSEARVSVLPYRERCSTLRGHEDASKHTSEIM
ncbi:unnamed protein product, partial [Iphiclides podalirius]